MDSKDLQTLVKRTQTGLERHLAPLGMLAVRLAIGSMFAQTGWGKLHNIERTTGYFESLGIPLPGFHAVVVGNFEFVGGLLLVFGLLTRLAALPLLATMVVAISTALLPDVEGVLDFLTLDEFLYLVILLLLVAQGAGRWSVDELLVRRVSALSFLREEQHPATSIRGEGTAS